MFSNYRGSGISETSHAIRPFWFSDKVDASFLGKDGSRLWFLQVEKSSPTAFLLICMLRVHGVKLGAIWA